MAKLFTLGGTPFSRPDSLARNVKSILHRHALESKLNKEEQALVQDLLQQGHHRAEEKIGCGVKHIKVGAHPDHPESRCFHLVRTDGTTTDFSYRKCIETLFGVEKSKPTKKQPFTSSYESGLVLRVAVNYPAPATGEKRKRDQVDEPTDGDGEEDGQGGGAVKRMKEEEKQGRPMQAAMKIKKYLREFGDVAYVEFDDSNPEAGATLRFNDTTSVAKVLEALKESVEVPDLPGVKLATPTLITGAEEEAYYERIALARQAPGASRRGSKRGGYHRTPGRRPRRGRGRGQ